MPKATVATRQLKCPNCGASLRWDGDARVVECRYCQTHVVVETRRATRERHDVVSKPATRAGLWIAVASALVVVAGLGAIFAAQSGRVGSGSEMGRTATAAEIAAVPLASTPQEVAARFGGAVEGSSVHVDLSDTTFRRVMFSWDEHHLDHVKLVALWPRAEDDPMTAVLEAARAQLGRALRPAATGGHQLTGGEGVTFAMSSGITIVAHGFEDPRWKDRLGALWTVLRAAALGAPERLDERTRREVLNMGYSLGMLAQLDLEVDIDGSQAHVRRMAPGAHTRGEHHTVGLDHPWFESLTLTWENRAGGKLERVSLYYPPEFDFRARAGDLASCLTPLLGEPERQVQDHVAGRFALDFDARDGRPRAHAADQLLMLFLAGGRGAPTSAAGVHEVLAALDRCGR